MTDNNQFQQFIGMSQILTGFSSSVLAPQVDPNPQPQAQQYFEFLNDPANGVAGELADLLQTYQRSVPNPPPPEPGTPAAVAVGDALMQTPAASLARRIIKLWFSGSWYDEKGDMLQVVTAQAYTNGLMWRAAQAHPMGYSRLRFGYWKDKPPPIDAFTGVNDGG